MAYVHAAATPEVFVTAHEALIHLGQLQRSDTVLIHAAAGGVGSAAVQLAYATGASIFATADASKRERVLQLGADHVIDYRAENFAEVIAREPNGRGVDVAVDFIGAPYFPRNIASLADGGRLVQVGILGGAGPVQVQLDQRLCRHLRIMGTVMKSRRPEEKRKRPANPSIVGSRILRAYVSTKRKRTREHDWPKSVRRADATVI